MEFISKGDYELQFNNVSSKPLSYYLDQIESLLSKYEGGKPGWEFYDGTLKHYVDCASLLTDYNHYRYAKILQKLVQIRWVFPSIIF
jgi:hypothetical protein